MAMSPRLLRPIASGVHPEASAWRSAVVANGGSVSASTMRAVSKFCGDIDKAGIRNRFYRLNLFCGSNLNAVLVPLYRGPSRNGTQYGGALESSVNFVAGDYAETGATGGLIGNGTSKYLQTGLTPNDIATEFPGGHLAAYKNTRVISGALIGSRFTNNVDFSNSAMFELGAGGNFFGGSQGAVGLSGINKDLMGVLRQSTTALFTIRNAEKSTAQATPVNPAGTQMPFAVFCRNIANAASAPSTYAPNLYTNQRLAGYSIGGGLSDAQLAAYSAAMSAFQAALFRDRPSSDPAFVSVTNEDAKLWIDEVYSNGGSVSTGTATAVNTFCNDIDAAGIRDRFYRLNLFCGTGLNAALVPLYRGPSRTGSQFGNTTDTNNGPFVSGDYTESSGLKGNGSSKYLETGVAMTFLGTNELHMFVSFNPEASELRALLGGRGNLAGALAVEGNYNGTTANRPRQSWFSGGTQPADHCSPITGRTQYFINYDGNQPLAIFGRNVNLNNINNAGAYSGVNNENILAFAINQTGTGIAAHSGQRMDAYSFGAAMISDAQRNSFHTAMSVFRTTLGRT